MTCPFCDSNDVEMVAPWGGQIITRQMRCRACNTYFEAIREEFDGAPDESEAARSWTTSSADDR
jgi:transcriptional regulator NrdR family protein